MRILQVVKTTRGATWAYNQAVCLHSMGVDIITVLPDDRSGNAARYQENGLRVIVGDWSLPVGKPWKFFARAKEIRRVLDSEKPDILHLHFVTNVLMARLALRRNQTPRLFQVPGPLHLESPLFRLLDKVTSTDADYWAGACKKTCEIYKQLGIDERRIFLAYYGTFKDEYGNSLPVGRLREEYGIGADSKIVSMVSYFYKPKKYLGQKRGLKGHEDFVDALALVLKAHPEITPMIIGNAWDGSEQYEQEVIRYAKRMLGDRIIFTGYRDDIQEIYPEIDIVVHPSHSENLGGAAESLAYGVPTVSSNVGGFPDIVKPYETGLLVNPKAPEELANAIIWLLEHPAQAHQMGKNGKILVRKMLNITATSENVYHIFSRILNGEG